MVGGAGNAPVVTSDSYLRHRFYRPAAGTPPEENPKSECRNPKQIQKRKRGNRKTRCGVCSCWFVPFAFLNFPQTDPHGDPIPDDHGKFNAAPQHMLLDIPLNKPARVSGIASQTTEMLELLRHKRISIGTRIEIKKKFPFDNSLELKIRNQQVIMVSEQVAKNILVNDEQ